MTACGRKNNLCDDAAKKSSDPIYVYELGRWIGLS
jgi:hypothetical protein